MASLSRFNCASLAMLFKLFDDELARLDTNLFNKFDVVDNLLLLLINKEDDVDDDEFDWSFIEFGDVVALLFVSDEADDVFVESDVWFDVLFNKER